MDFKLLISAICSESEESRKWAVLSVAFISYICSSDINRDVWTFCGDVLCKSSEAEPPTVAIQAAAAGLFCLFHFSLFCPHSVCTSSLSACYIDAWVLLSSTMAPEAVVGQSRERIFPFVIQLMQEAGTDVRVR